MQLPTPLPTDNLYKFGTILGIVVLVAAGYLWGTLQTDLGVKATAAVQAAAATSRPILTQDDPRISEFYRISRNNAWSFGTIAALGLIASGWSLRLWYVKHQSLQDELLRLEVDAARRKAAPTSADPKSTQE